MARTINLFTQEPSGHVMAPRVPPDPPYLGLEMSGSEAIYFLVLCWNRCLFVVLESKKNKNRALFKVLREARLAASLEIIFVLKNTRVDAERQVFTTGILPRDDTSLSVAGHHEIWLSYRVKEEVAS